MWVYGTEPAHLQLRKFDAHPIKFLEVTTVNEKKKQYYLYINGEAAPVTEKVYNGIWLEQILETLTEEERGIIREFYINGRTERAACDALGIPRTTFQYREKRLREKTGILLKNFL